MHLRGTQRYRIPMQFRESSTGRARQLSQTKPPGSSFVNGLKNPKSLCICEGARHTDLYQFSRKYTKNAVWFAMRPIPARDNAALGRSACRQRPPRYYPAGSICAVLIISHFPRAFNGEVQWRYLFGDDVLSTSPQFVWRLQKSTLCQVIPSAAKESARFSSGPAVTPTDAGFHQCSPRKPAKKQAWFIS